MRIHTHEQLLTLLDEIVANSVRGDRTSPEAGVFWTDLLTRAGHPLAGDRPDECLLDWHRRGLLGDLAGRRVLDIGCGGGRNTRWLAEQGANVDGIDIATDLLARIAHTMPDAVTLTVCDIVRDPLPHTVYDLVYDSGCFHHLAPHRRETYRDRVFDALAAGGHFGIVTFAGDQIDLASDTEIVVSGDVGGGIGFSLEDLVEIFDPLTLVAGRPLRPDVDGAFGEPFLNAALFGAAR